MSELNVEYVIMMFIGVGYELFDEVMKIVVGVEVEVVLFEVCNCCVFEVIDEKVWELGVDLIIVGCYGWCGLVILIFGLVVE